MRAGLRRQPASECGPVLPRAHGALPPLTTAPRQDAQANTPLHYAISAGAGASGIVEVLTEVPGIDVTPTNSQGFTLLHHAALKGHAL